MESLEARVKKIIVEQLSVEEDAVKSEAKFVDDLGADSLDIVELVMALEEEFAKAPLEVSQFRRDGAVDPVTDLVELVLGHVADALVGIKAGLGADTLRRGLADSEDVGERDFQPLFAGNVDAGDTCHRSFFSFSPGAACDGGSRRSLARCHGGG